MAKNRLKRDVVIDGCYMLCPKADWRPSKSAVLLYVGADDSQGQWWPGGSCRPVYFESCACVVKDAVKCSFECLSVVHHTCGIHSVGVGDGEMIK